MIIDSHQHFWRYHPVRNQWITNEMQKIRKDFLPQDLKSILQQNDVDGCIAVQADQSEEESLFLLKLAEENNFIKGVVGWVDLCSENSDNRLHYFSEFDKFCGVRHIVQAENTGFLLRKDFQNGIKQLSKYDLTYDILVNYKQLPEVVSFVEKFPEQSFILDHLGKPPIASRELGNWKKNIRTLAKFPKVSCKISGMTTEADWKHWEMADFAPFLDVVFDAFGTKRVLYGSDWPVCLLAVEYEEQLCIIKNYISKFSSEERAKIMGRNAIDIYNLINI